MASYELVLILNPDVATEEEVKAAVDAVGKSITDRGGTVGEVNHWGKQKMAHAIKRFTQGDYFLAKFQLEPTAVKEFDTSLKLSPNIIRYLIVRTDN